MGFFIMVIDLGGLGCRVLESESTSIRGKIQVQANRVEVVLGA
jgi:hypothetical protein